MKNLEHPNIVQYHDHAEKEGKKFLFMEYCDGTLFDLVENTEKGRLSEEDTQLIVI